MSIHVSFFDAPYLVRYADRFYDPLTPPTIEPIIIAGPFEFHQNEKCSSFETHFVTKAVCMLGRSAGIALELASLERPKNSESKYIFEILQLRFFLVELKKSLKKMVKKIGNFKNLNIFQNFEISIF